MLFDRQNFRPKARYNMTRIERPERQNYHDKAERHEHHEQRNNVQHERQNYKERPERCDYNDMHEIQNYKERPERRDYNDMHERKSGLGINKNSKALKFSYNNYESLKKDVDDVENEDLLRVLIARAHKEGQLPLKKCLEIVLRAMYHECNFPSLPPPKSSYQQKSFNKTFNANTTVNDQTKTSEEL